MVVGLSKHNSSIIHSRQRKENNRIAIICKISSRMLNMYRITGLFTMENNFHLHPVTLRIRSIVIKGVNPLKEHGIMIHYDRLMKSIIKTSHLIIWTIRAWLNLTNSWIKMSSFLHLTTLEIKSPSIWTPLNNKLTILLNISQKPRLGLNTSQNKEVPKFGQRISLTDLN